MTTDRSPSALARTFLEAHRDTPLRDRVLHALDPNAVDARFLERAQAGLAAAEAAAGEVTCLAVVTDPYTPEEQDPLGLASLDVHDRRAAQQEIAVGLAEESFPLVLLFAQAYGAGAAPDIHAGGEEGVSDNLGDSDRWPETFHDDFRVNPAPVLELASLQGAAWLGLTDRPDPLDFGHDGPDRGDITRYFETHEPGGADGLTATAVFAAGGVGLFWFFSRRARLSHERSQSAGNGSRLPTPVPEDVVEHLPDLLAREFPVIDPQDAATEEGLDAAVGLRDAIADHAVLRDRVASRLREAEAAFTPADVDPVVPPVEVASLLVLDERITAGVRAWEAHVQDGTPLEESALPQRCAINPFHGPATGRAAIVGRSAAIDVPVCDDCREAAGRDDPQGMLRVTQGRRTRVRRGRRRVRAVPLRSALTAGPRCAHRTRLRACGNARAGHFRGARDPQLGDRPDHHPPGRRTRGRSPVDRTLRSRGRAVLHARGAGRACGPDRPDRRRLPGDQLFQGHGHRIPRRAHGGWPRRPRPRARPVQRR